MISGGSATNSTHNNSCSAHKGLGFHGSGMGLYPAMSVEEESSDSDQDEEMEIRDDAPAEDINQPDPFEFNPKNFYWVFNPDMKFNSRANFSLDDDINPLDFMEMRKINRRVLTGFFRDLQEGGQ